MVNFFYFLFSLSFCHFCICYFGHSFVVVMNLDIREQLLFLTTFSSSTCTVCDELQCEYSSYLISVFISELLDFLHFIQIKRIQPIFFIFFIFFYYPIVFFLLALILQWVSISFIFYHFCRNYYL